MIFANKDWKAVGADNSKDYIKTAIVYYEVLEKTDKAYIEAEARLFMTLDGRFELYVDVDLRDSSTYDYIESIGNHTYHPTEVTEVDIVKEIVCYNLRMSDYLRSKYKGFFRV